MWSPEKKEEEAEKKRHQQMEDENSPDRLSSHDFLCGDFISKRHFTICLNGIDSVAFANSIFLPYFKSHRVIESSQSAYFPVAILGMPLATT